LLTNDSEEVKEAIRTKECEYKDAVAQCAGQVADISANYFVEAVLKSVKKEAKDAIAKSQLETSNAALYKKNWDSSLKAASMAKEKAQKRMEKAKKEIADLEVENDQKDARIADLEAENNAKDAKIAELKAQIEAMNST
jgi:chromosome segregation ATPase